jgi:hypothetical protein
MALLSGAAKICKEIESRFKFMQKQREAGHDTAKLEATQVTKLCQFIARAGLSADDGTRITECIRDCKSDMSEESEHSLGIAVANAVVEYSDGEHDAAERDRGRGQQSCEFIERFAVTEKDVDEMAARQGDEEFACLRVGTRAWMAGLTCPRELVKARLGALTQVLGGLATDAGAAERKRIAERVRGNIKRRDAKVDHPFPHMSRFPDDPTSLSDGRFMYAYGDDPPAVLSVEVVYKINSILSSGGCRTTHRDIRTNAHQLSSSALVPVVADRRCAPTLDMRENASPRDAIAEGMQQMQQMQQQMQQMCMMQMRCMGMAGKGGANMPAFGGFGAFDSNGGAPDVGGGSRGGESSLNHFRRSRGNDNDHLGQGNVLRRLSTVCSGRDASKFEECGDLVALADDETGAAAAGANAASERVDIGMRNVLSMERAQVAMALDAKKRKLEQATSKAALKKPKPSPSKPA